MPQSSPFAFLKGSITFRPWVYFPIFLAANSLLSYFLIPFQAALWVGLVGLLLPFGLGLCLALEDRLGGGAKIPFEGEGLKLPPGFWVLFTFALFFTRFYRLTTLPFWPLTDEGIFFSMASDQSHHWTWRLLWGEIQFEPLMVWLLAGVFKLISPSLFSVRLLPAVISLLTSWASYAAARRFFSQTTSVLFCALLTFSFWEFTLSRLCILVILVPLFQCLAFNRLGAFFLSESRRSEWKNIVLLGIAGGVGFYTWTNWVFVWLSLAALLLGYCFLGGKGLRNPVLFMGISFLLVIPIAWARLQPGASSHLHRLFTLSPWEPLLLNLKGVFWDGSASFPYGSNWGGFLNPVLDSLALVGLLHLIQTAKRPLLAGIAALCFLYILPGALSNGVELYRLLPLLPLLTLMAAWGAGRLLQTNGSWVLQGGVLLLLLGSFCLDTYNFTACYCDMNSYPPNRRWREVEYFHAYQVLDKLSRQDGPLDVFTEFNMDYDDKTLNPACYPFDAIQNPAWSAARPRWAALLGDVRFAPFLQKRFPGLRYEILNPGLPPGDQHRFLGLFLIPAQEIPSSTLQAWIQAEQVYARVNLEVKNRNPLFSWAGFPGRFESLRDSSSGDPFLATVYWEKVASFEVMAGDFPAAARAYQNAARQGYPLQSLLFNAQLASRLSAQTPPLPSP
ncbi:MAG TPA: glycosyltransferase family 39 protein [bacterium]|jgi:hypothetical protein|nr:glycosyltransferase family 39 protein [bacterium]